jgi:putative transposase
VMQAMMHPPAARRRPWVVAEPDAVPGAWYPNLRAGLIPTGPNQLWVANIAYVRLQRGFVFLVVVLDVCARKVIGYAADSGFRWPRLTWSREGAHQEWGRRP